MPWNFFQILKVLFKHTNKAELDLKWPFFGRFIFKTTNFKHEGWKDGKFAKTIQLVKRKW